MFVMGNFYCLIQDNLLLLCAPKIGSGKRNLGINRKRLLLYGDKVLVESDDDSCVVTSFLQSNLLNIRFHQHIK